MAIREILTVPDPRLKEVSQPVDKVDDDLRELMDDMLQTMYAADGIGLAAIQVGVPKRVLVIDLQPEDTDAEPEPCNHDGHEHVHYPVKKEPRVFINPEILDPGMNWRPTRKAAFRFPTSSPMSTARQPAACATRTSRARPMKKTWTG